MPSWPSTLIELKKKNHVPSLAWGSRSPHVIVHLSLPAATSKSTQGIPDNRASSRQPSTIPSDYDVQTRTAGELNAGSNRTQGGITPDPVRPRGRTLVQTRRFDAGGPGQPPFRFPSQDPATAGQPTSSAARRPGPRRCGLIRVMPCEAHPMFHTLQASYPPHSSELLTLETQGPAHGQPSPKPPTIPLSFPFFTRFRRPKECSSPKSLADLSWPAITTLFGLGRNPPLTSERGGPRR